MFETGFSEAWHWPSRLGRLATKTQESTCLQLPFIRIMTASPHTRFIFKHRFKRTSNRRPPDCNVHSAKRAPPQHSRKFFRRFLLLLFFGTYVCYINLCMGIGMCVGTYVGMGICAFVWRLEINTKWFPQSISILFTVAVTLTEPTAGQFEPV